MLHVEELGIGDPLILFLPGLTGTTRYWRGRVDHLADANRLLLVDLLGFGRSPRPRGPYDVERHVAELHETIKDRGRLTLVGHSLGAIVAVAYAARHPKMIERLVLISLPHFKGKEHAIAHLRRNGRYALSVRVVASALCVFARRVIGPFLPYLGLAYPPEVLEDMRLHDAHTFSSTLWETIYGHSVVEDVEDLPPDLPVIAVHGEDDNTAPLSAVQELAAGRPSWTLHLRSGVGHHPVLHAPDWALQPLMADQAVAEPTLSRSTFSITS